MVECVDNHELILYIKYSIFSVKRTPIMINIKHFIFISLALLALVSVNAQAALSATDKQYISDLKKGDLKLLKRTAKLIIRNAVRTPEVLDVVTEILLQISPNLDNGQVSTFTYLARAVGESENGRYYSALREVKETTNSKHVRKWAKKAYKMIGKKRAKKATQYKKGMVKLTTTKYIIK